jgi:CheY-like chemotaxis protein
MTPPAARECILAVDDTPETLEVLDRNLTSHGYRVLCASGVSEAIHQLDIDTVDILITDLKMPGASGLDLIRHVQEHRGRT